ncbi:AI-2E family transporter [Collimonas sp. OK412]|jgi:predicted PurR-regulated permease PerM|uniref:AI-2E family transporter n=1 Tax=Collimonas sp. (strain OK412) TaxID=1801619 RepID=UPI0008E2D9E5|nr:AI-2E family transporter [Collimonas sp. OK412]SFC53517.1 Predicted PurR-regulated permease PerM [Collimonas sp. OK412]
MPFSFTDEQKQTALWLGLGLLLIALMVALGPILTPFIASAILAYALNPGVDWLARRKIGKFPFPRALAVLIVILLLVFAILAVILIVVPVLRKEFPLLQDQIPNFLNKLDGVIGPHLQDFGINVRLDGTGIKEMLTKQLATSGDEIWTSVLASVKVGGTAVLGWLATILLVPVVLFYLLQDWHAIVARASRLVPRRWQGKIGNMTQEVDSLLAQYLRGQLLVMLVLAIYYSTGLAIAGFDVALPVGIITGLLVFIPYVGFGLGLGLALIAAMLQFSGWHGLIAVAIVYGIGQVLESFILTPRLVGERIGLHPLVVIFALMAFGQLFGFVGILLALPCSAIMSVVVKHVRAHYLDSSFYNT